MGDVFSRARRIDRGYALDFPDGAVEIIQPGAVNGPDQVGGRHFGRSYTYARFVRPDGTAGPWRRSSIRSLAKAVMEAGDWGSCDVAASAVSEPEPEPEGRS